MLCFLWIYISCCLSVILNVLWASCSLVITWLSIRSDLFWWRMLSILLMQVLSLLINAVYFFPISSLKTLLLCFSLFFCLQSIGNLSIHLHLVSNSLRLALLSWNLMWSSLCLLISSFWKWSVRLLTWVLLLTILLKLSSWEIFPLGPYWCKSTLHFGKKMSSHTLK